MIQQLDAEDVGDVEDSLVPRVLALGGRDIAVDIRNLHEFTCNALRLNPPSHDSKWYDLPSGVPSWRTPAPHRMSMEYAVHVRVRTLDTVGAETHICNLLIWRCECESREHVKL